MNKVAHYLQEHLQGEVISSAEARQYFATDGSIFGMVPAIIVYPDGENDVRKTARFTWQMAERGKVIPITARGSGTDQGGGAIGSGVVMVFPAHMNRVMEFDSKSGKVSVEPGLNYGKLQQALHTHDRFLPPYPASLEYSTIGGAIANNASGEKSFRYGDTRNYAKGLRVVLANGEAIETKRLTKRELSKKLGLSTFEGEVYRSLDALIEENRQDIKDGKLGVSKSSAGYDLASVKRKDGSFDLTPLFVGSQGTLGIVTEATLDTEFYTKATTLISAHFDSLEVAEEAITEIRKLQDLPSCIEAVDDSLLKFVQKYNPNLLKGVIKSPFPKIILLIEFDNPNDRQQKRSAKKATKILSKLQVPTTTETDPTKQDLLWKIRRSASMVTSYADSSARALPIIEDGVVPIDRFKDYITAVYEMFNRYGLESAMWGHAGDANLHIQPVLDLAHVGDRQKVFRMLDEYYELVIGMNGSTTGEHGDGRIRAPYLPKLYGPTIYSLFEKTKKIFDPYGTMNPGVKIGVTLDDIKPLLRHEYSLKHLHDHMPSS